MSEQIFNNILRHKLEQAQRSYFSSFKKYNSAGPGTWGQGIPLEYPVKHKNIIWLAKVMAEFQEGQSTLKEIEFPKRRAACAALVSLSTGIYVSYLQQAKEVCDQFVVDMSGQEPAECLLSDSYDPTTPWKSIVLTTKARYLSLDALSPSLSIDAEGEWNMRGETTQSLMQKLSGLRYLLNYCTRPNTQAEKLLGYGAASMVLQHYYPDAYQATLTGPEVLNTRGLSWSDMFGMVPGEDPLPTA